MSLLERKTKQRISGSPIYPLCHQRAPSIGKHWTPALIRKHETGCNHCQQLHEAVPVPRQSEYRTRHRASLSEFFVGLPFDPDDEEAGAYYGEG